MSNRNWEKGTAAPIPQSKYLRFKETLAEYSPKYSDRNVTLFILARATGYRMGDLTGLTVGELKDALNEVRETGYGLVAPELSEMKFEEPEIVRQGNKFGVKIRSVAPSIHLIRANIETEIAPIIGTKEQAEGLLEYMKEGKDSEEGFLNTNIFGKTIGELVEDGIRTKISMMDEQSQMKLQETMQKIVNDSNGGMICIII